MRRAFIHMFSFIFNTKYEIYIFHIVFLFFSIKYVENLSLSIYIHIKKNIDYLIVVV